MSKPILMNMVFLMKKQGLIQEFNGGCLGSSNESRGLFTMPNVIRVSHFLKTALLVRCADSILLAIMPAGATLTSLLVTETKRT